MDQHSISLHFVKFILRSPSGLFILSMSNEMWNLLELFLQIGPLFYFIYLLGVKMCGEWVSWVD